MKKLTLLLIILGTGACSYLPIGFDPVAGATVLETRDYIEVSPDSGTPLTGLVFYPGGLVDPHAYIPLVSRVATNGYHSFIMKAPLNLSVMSWSQADDVVNNFDSITHWFIGGHSLGGAMGARYYFENQDKISGLFLLAAWPTADWDLSLTTNSYLLLSGSQDGVATQDEVLSNIQYLPPVIMVSNSSQILTNSSSQTFWYEIPGGNHAQFGNYGEQDGDGTATMSRDQQQDEAARLIILYMQGRGY